MTSISYNGLEICYHAFKDQIKRESDLVVLFVHWYLVKNGFVCVVDGRKTEILSSNWNADKEIYVIDYSLDSKGFELKVLTAEDSLIINLMKKSNERTGNITCRVKDHVSNYKNEFQNLFMNLQDLYESIQKEFLPLFQVEEKNVKESKSTDDVPKTKSKPSYDPLVTDHDPLRVNNPYRRPFDPANIGRDDLDPFRFDPLGGGGGMYFDPFRNRTGPQIPPNIPRGSVPPGARFDPFGPPDPDSFIPGGINRVGPNPNHQKPPGFDDMFM